MKNLCATKKSFVILGFILLSIFILKSPVAAEKTTIFGPEQYTRTRGWPQTFTETFKFCGTASCQIIVRTGKAKEKNRITSASIFLNGSKIVGPRDFRGHIKRDFRGHIKRGFRGHIQRDFRRHIKKIVRPIELLDENELSIKLASKPGSFLIVEVQCDAPPADLSVSGWGVNLLDSSTLISAFRIGNSGTVAAENVQVSSIVLADGSLISPDPLPVSLNTIPVDDSAVLNASFSGSFSPLGSYGQTVEGTYDVGDATYCFTLDSDLEVPPEAPGNSDLNTAMVDSNVNDPPYEPRPPSFSRAVNPPLWTVPVAPFVPGTPTEDGTGVEAAPPLSSESISSILQDAAPAIVFESNTDGISGGAVASTSTIAEPSGASDGNGVVFVTANSFASYSTDGGTNFTPIDPTAVFPADTVGFCCDQVVQYVPSIDRFIWLLQGSTGGTQAGGYRLASASPQNIIDSGATAWTYWNLTPQVFGQPMGTGFDYPDMSVGNDYLYLSWDAGFGCPAGCTQGFQVARINLSDIEAGGTIGIGFTDPANGRVAWGAHISQNTLDEVFWAGHNDNSSMRVFTLAEDSNTYFWRDIGISSWATGGLSSTTPDVQDWLTKLRNFPNNAVHGLTRNGSHYWFAWSAGTDDNFDQPHVEMVTLDRNDDFSVVQQVQIWNDDYAFAYPALSTNRCTFEIGLSLEYGGNGDYENHVVGFWGDFVVYITTDSDVGTTRYGDYVTIRQEPPNDLNPGNLFSAFGYGLNAIPPPGSGTQTDVHYVRFGRPPSSCIIIK